MNRILLVLLVVAAIGCSADPVQMGGGPVVAVQEPAATGNPTTPQPGISQGPVVNQPVAMPNLGNPNADAAQPPGQETTPPQQQTPPTPVEPVAGAPAPVDPPVQDDQGPPPMIGSKTPTIPEVTADCPTWRSGTITFMGLGGIRIEAGPKAASPTAPMVFYWHGTGSTSGEYAFMAGAVNQGVASEGGILVSFQGSTGGDLLSGTAIFGEGDFALADQLLACAVRDHNIDPTRVFATGCSAGGLFSGAMAAMRSQYIAAAAPNSGGWTVPVRFANDYTPALMTIHGAPGQDVVIIDFSNSSATADKAFKDRGGFVINCNHGGGHCGGGGLAPDIWKFFKAHPYGVEPYPWDSLPAGFNSACKIY